MIVDSHQHFWRLDHEWTDWPTPDLTPIYRDFQPEDVRPVLERNGVDAAIAVQAAPSTEDMADLLALARSSDFLIGIVGWIDFAEPAAGLAQLERWGADPLLLGVRPMLQGMEQENWINDPPRRPLLSALAERNLVFDALIQPRHLPAIIQLASDHPGLSIVVDHAGKPDIASRAVDQWTQDIRLLARAPNVSCKLSGLLTEAAPMDETDALMPVVNCLLDSFGPDRLLWGSDWPVVDLAGGYDRWFSMTRSLLALLTAEQRAAIMGGNALRIYRPNIVTTSGEYE